MKTRFLVFFIAFFSIAATADAVLRETRAVWLTTIFGLDWPKAKTAEAQKRELCLMLDSLQGAGINTVLFQTRVRGTVVYPSRLEPWDKVFGGRSPGYDPLQFAIDECHARGMQLHAWVVAMLLENKKAMDPGLPATGLRIASICREIATNYDVDGIHLDYIRYPDSEYRLNDNATYRRYGKRQDRHQWKRQNITSIVRLVHSTVKSVKPWICLSCSPIGKRDDLSRFSSRGWNARNAVHQDVGAWLKEGLMDAIFPMMYFREDQFFPFAKDWKEQSAGHIVAPGLGVYMMETAGWPLDELKRQLFFLRGEGMGQCFFRASFVLDDSRGFYSFLRWFNMEPALPAAHAADGARIAPPHITDSTSAGIIRWKAEQQFLYNIYAVQDGDTILVRPALRGGEWRYNPYVALSGRLRFVVKAMDRYGRESL